MGSSRFDDSSETPWEPRRPEVEVAYGRPAALSAGTPGVEIARLPLLAADPRRPRRIDRYIDYFGSGAARGAGVATDPCGEWALDALTGRAHPSVLAWLTRDEGLHHGLDIPSPWRLV